MQLPCVRLRLSRLEIGLIMPVLRRLVSADRLWVNNGEIVRAGQDICFYARPFDPSRYRSDGMRPFAGALSKLDEQPAGGRLRFDHLELAACAYAARTTRSWVIHGLLQPCLPDHNRLNKKLLLKLERYRRRARRRCESLLGDDAYLASREGWSEVLRWIKTYYLWRPTGPDQVSANLRRWQRGVVDRCVELAAEGLRRRHCYPPQPRQLRQMVRSALRSVRRGYAQMGVRTILERPREGADCLAAFLVRTRGDQFGHFDLSTVLSDRAQRIAPRARRTCCSNGAL